MSGVASDKDLYSYIQEDFFNLKEILELFEDNNKIILRTDEIVTLELIIKRLGRDRLYPWMFYFSGHSTDKMIMLNDREVPILEFANLFRTGSGERRIEIAFFNSCDSKDIGTAVIDAGVNVAIVTLRDIEAGLANTISKVFFGKLMVAKTVMEAYNFAENMFNIVTTHIDPAKRPLFPCRIMSRQETQLTKELPKFRYSPEQSYFIATHMINSELQMLDAVKEYSIKQKVNINNDSYDEHLKTINTSLNKMTPLIQKGENFQNILRVIQKGDRAKLTPSRLLNVKGSISEVKDPVNFKKKALFELEQLINKSAIT